MAAPPTILAGRFRIDATVATGGMGSVFAATDLSLGRTVAIKMLRAELATDAEALERFREEAFSLGSLHHPNIVQLFDFHGGDAAGAFLVMDLVQGETLHERLRRPQMASLPIATAIDYAQQILSALAAAHQKGIVHRDIKPANLIIVALPARRELVKVLDFGIAKLTETTIRRRPTTAGMLLGTPLWMAPEQTGGAIIDARTDVYAVGLVLFRMLTGTNPFEGFDMAATLERVASFVPPDVRMLRPDTPPHVAAAVARALAKNPAHRFASAVELAEALGVGELTARGPSLTPPGAPPTWSAPAPSLATTAAAVPTESGGKSAVIGALVALGVVFVLALGGVSAWFLTRGEPGARAVPVDAAAPATIVQPVPSVSPLAVTVAPAPSVTVAPTPRSTRTPSASASASAAPVGSISAVGAGPLGGKCMCLPDRGTSHHGNNQRLSPRAVPLECQCVASNMGLCQDPIVPCNGKPGCDDTCKRRFFPSTFGAPCHGFDSTGAAHDATINECRYPNDGLNVFAGPVGRTCKGLDHDGKLVDGHVFCRE